MAKFLYFQNVLRSGERVQKPITARMIFGWKKFKDIASMLCERVVYLKLMQASTEIVQELPYVMVPRTGLSRKKMKKGSKLLKLECCE